MLQEQDLRKTSYLVVVKILEARDLKGESTGGVNPYVKIQCGNLQPQQTKTVYMTSYAIWNQSFTFPDLNMNKFELESLELQFTVYDQHNWWTNSEIGSYSVGLSTMYRYPNGDLHKKWIRLAKSDNPSKVVGYLQVSCFIVGPGEDPPVHDEFEGSGDSMAQQMMRDGINPDAILEKQKALQGLSIVDAPKLNLIPYQLIVNIYKGESFCALADEEFPNAFMTVRSQNCSLDTRSNKNSGNPNWQQKIQIPVYTPTYNEKIRVSVWHNAGEFFDSQDLFIANVPELPSATDVMNIQSLHSKEGKMLPMWFNLYGSRHKEHDNTEPRLYSTSFMGRVLMSFHLLPNTRPVLSLSASQVASKIQIHTYRLWIDVYDLVNCDDLLQRHRHPTSVVTIQAFINGKVSEKLILTKNTLTNTSFTFQINKKDPAHKLDILDLSLPQDIGQIPHLFVNINITEYPKDYDPKKNKEKLINHRIGFVRLIPKDIIVTSESNSRPQWHIVQSIANRKTNCGRLLINARLSNLKDKAKVKRDHKPRGRDVQYHFFAQIFNGYELAPNIPEEDLRTRVEIKIGLSGMKAKPGKRTGHEQKDIKTRVLPGRFPQWHWSKNAQMVTMSDVAEFASDMRVQLFQIEESLYKGKNQKMVGQFLIPVSSMINNQLYTRPQYFNIVDGEGKMQGKILARFYLIKRSQQQDDAENVTKCYKFMKQMLEKRPYVVDLKVSVLGLRSLVKATETAQMEICLTNYENIHGITVQEAYRKNKNKKRNGNDEEGAGIESEHDEEMGNLQGEQKKIQMEGVQYKQDGSIWIDQKQPEEDAKPTVNPNFGKVLCFEQILLQEDMLLWPHLIIKLFDNGIGTLDDRNKETSRIVLPIFIFSQSFMPEAQIKISLAMLMENLSSENQRQENPLQIYMSQLVRQLQQQGQNQMDRMFSLKLEGKEEVYIQLLQNNDEEISIESIMKLFNFDDNMIIDTEFEQKTLDSKDKANKHKDKKEGDHATKKGGKQAKKVEDEDEESEIDKEDFKDLADVWREFLEDKENPNAKILNGDNKKGKGSDKKKGDDSDDDNLMKLLGGGASQSTGVTLSQFEEDAKIPEFEIINLVCEDQNKRIELDKKAERKRELENLLRHLQKIQDNLPNKSDWKENIRFQLMNCRQKIVEQDSNIVEEQDFILTGDNDDENNNQDIYGKREVHQGPLEALLNEIVPFMTIEMLEQTFNTLLFTTDNYSINNGIFSAGKANGSTLRFAVAVEKLDELTNMIDKQGRKGKKRDSDDSSDGSEGESRDSEKSFDGEFSDENMDSADNQRLTVGQPADNWQKALLGENEQAKQEEERKQAEQDIKEQHAKDEEFFKFVQKIDTTADQVIERLEKDGYKVDIFRPSTIKAMVADYDFTLRVFIRSCQNLSAVDNRVNNWRNILAGDKALSSADPFLMMRIVGDEEEDFHNGRDKFQEETLNPTFNDAEEKGPIRLQENWKLEIEVRDKGSFELQDTMIGKTIIDLEQRRWSMKYALAKLIFDQEIQMCKEEAENYKKANQNLRRKKNPAQELRIKYLDHKRPRFQKALDDFKKKEMPQSHVEYRPLLHPDKEQAQGMAELWVEVLDLDESRQMVFQKAKEKKDDENFEVRLIIWETRDVPPPNGSVMDAQITASYQPQGLSQETIEKSTDIHQGCKNGKAVFNYRMIFQVGRDEFPRLKLQVRDTGLAGAEAIGELTLDLRESIKLLKKFGILEDNKIFLPFINPSKDGAETGHCLVQIQVLHETDAQNDPVGEAQDEPNENPKLIRPEEGRSFGDKLAGLGLSMPDIALPDMFGLIKKVIIAVMVSMALFFVMFLVLAVK